MASFGNFKLKLPDEEAACDFSDFNAEDFDSFLATVKASDIQSFDYIQALFDQSAIEGLPRPEMPRQRSEQKTESEVEGTQPTKRFMTGSPQEVNKYVEMKQSEATKNNTEWGIKLFQVDITSLLAFGVERSPLWPRPTIVFKSGSFYSCLAFIIKGVGRLARPLYTVTGLVVLLGVFGCMHQ